MKNCPICKVETALNFRGKLLNKYNVDYYKCPNCGFINTDNSFCLEEAYGTAISSFDIGLVGRNLIVAETLDRIIRKSFDCKQQFLDYAGGYGMLTRLMRDRGFDFYWEDRFCDNLFAQHFTSADRMSKSKYELISVIEVFEHISNPMEEFEKLFDQSDTIFFSTELIPEKELKSTADWWYFSEEMGQHISFYSLDSLKIIADRFSANLYTYGNNIHILTKKILDKDPFISKRTLRIKISEKLTRIILKKEVSEYLPSKISADFSYVKALNKNQITE